MGVIQSPVPVITCRLWQRSQCTASPPLPPLGSVPLGPGPASARRRGCTGKAFEKHRPDVLLTIRRLSVHSPVD